MTRAQKSALFWTVAGLASSAVSLYYTAKLASVVYRAPEILSSQFHLGFWAGLQGSRAAFNALTRGVGLAARVFP